MLSAIINEISTVTKSPFLTKGTAVSCTEIFPVPWVFWILHMISLPNVVAPINVKESIVDIITDSIPIKKIPIANWGRTSSANFKYDKEGSISDSNALAYNPEKSVSMSKISQKNTDSRIPCRAVCGDLAAAHRW